MFKKIKEQNFFYFQFPVKKLGNYVLTVLIGLLFSPCLFSQIQLFEINYGTSTFYEGQNLFQDKLLREAELKILKTIEKYPLNPSYGKAELLRANVDLISGNYEVSKNILEKFIEKYPNSPLISHALIQIAFINLQEGKFDIAQKYFEKTLEQINQEVNQRKKTEDYLELKEESLFWMGIAIYQQGKYYESMPPFRQLAAEFPNSKYSDDACFAVGLTYERNREYDSAIVNFNQIINNYPFSNSILAALVRSSNNYILLRKASRALFDLETASIITGHIDSKDSIGKLYQKQDYLLYPADEVNYLKGEAYNVVGNYSKAVATFKSFIETYNSSPLRTYFLLGLAWANLNLGNYPDALDNYEKVIASAKSDEKYLKNIAELNHAITFAKAGQIDESEKELGALVSRSDFPFVGIAMLELAQMNYSSENFNEAKKNLVRAEREDNSARISARIHLMLGATYLQLRNYNDALFEFDKVKTIVQNSDPIFLPEKDYFLSEILFKKAVCLIQTYRYAEAIQNLNNYLAGKVEPVRTNEAMFWLAESYYRSDLLKNAQKSYETLFADNPNFRKEEVLYGLGWSYFRDKNFKKSTEYFNLLSNDFPKSKFAVEVLARQADAYYLEKNYTQAANYYEKASKIAPKTEEGQYSAYQLCHALYRNSQYEKAVSSLMDFIAKYPNSNFSPNAVYLVGWIKFNQKQYTEAVNNFRYLIEAYSQSSLVPRAYYSIGDAFYNQQKFESAIEYYRKVVEHYPSDPLAPEALKSTQFCYVALGQQEKAIELADKYIESNPNSPFVEEFAYKKAEMFFSGQKYADAVTEYDKFLQKHPDSELNPEAMYWMGKSYKNMNETDKALLAFSKLSSKYPKSEFAPIALLEMAQIKMDKTFLQEAETIYSQIESAYPETEVAAQAGYKRAEIALTYGDTLKTLAIYKNVADKFPSNGYGLSSRYRVGMYYRNNSMYDSARKEFEILASISQDKDLTAESQYRVGELWMRMKNYEEAIKAFQIVKDKSSDVEVWFPLSLLNMGEAYEKINDLQKASEIYKALIAINPDDDYAKTARNRLKTIQKILGQ
jgi:tol-pal system protein YbgF